jgi:hypothetical protein
MLEIVILGFAFLAAAAVWLAIHLIVSNANGITSAYSVGCPRHVLPEVVTWLVVPDGGILADVGCGDGRVIGAFLRANHEARAHGIENNPAIYLVALISLWRYGMRRRVTLGDARKWSDGQADCIYAYLSPRMMAQLEPSIKQQFPKAKRLVSLQFPLPTLAPQHTILLANGQPHAHTLYVYDF